MPINKNAIIRYNTLDKCFRNTGRNYFIEDLLNSVNQALLDLNPDSKGIAIRQLREDIRFMRNEDGYDAPIEVIKQNKKGIYRYSDSSFSINQSPLNATEKEKLKSALSILNRFEGSVEFEWLTDIAPILDDHFGLKSKKQKIIGHDTNVDYTGYKWITSLFNSISNEIVLHLEYKTFDLKSFKFNFHPYYLKQYNKRWFVFGLNTSNQNPQWNVPLDRIESITETTIEYIKDTTDWEDYFDDIIGVTKPHNAVNTTDVLLKFSKEQAPYVITKPLHLSQKKPKINEDGSVEIRINVILNKELERLILSYGSAVQVIEPSELRQNIANTINETQKTYLCR